MIRCDQCDSIFDSDEDPDCFVENPGLPGSMGDEVLCKWCREQREAEQDAGDARAALAEAREQGTVPLDEVKKDISQ